MRLEKLTLQAITRYDKEVSIDFSSFGPGLIALAGGNGAGKTTILESPFAAQHLEYPTYPGGLYAVAHGKNAKIDLRFQSGGTFHSLVAIDALSQKTEPYLFDGNENPLTDGSVRGYQAEIKKRFGSSRLMLSAALLCQTRRGSFIDLSKAERKDLLAEILDTANLQSLSERASKATSRLQSELEVTRGLLSVYEDQYFEAHGKEQDLDALEVTKKAHEETVEQQKRELDAIRTEYSTLKASLNRIEEIRRKLNSLKLELDKTTTAISDTIEKRDKISQEREEICSRAKTQIELARAAAAKLPQYRERVEKLSELEKERIGLRELEGRLVVELDDTTKQLQALESYAQEFRRVKREIEQANRQAALIKDVPCHAEGEFAGCQLLVSAVSAKKSIGELEKSLDELVQKLAGREDVESSAVAIKARVDEVRNTISSRDVEIRAFGQAHANLVSAEAADKRVGEIEQNKEMAINGLIKRFRDLDERIAEDRRRSEAIKQEIAGIPEPDTLAYEVKLSQIEGRGRLLKSSIAEEEQTVKKMTETIAQVKAVVETCKKLAIQIQEAKNKIEDLNRNIVDWSVLERALGRDGIQALEIDAAGPELSSLATELLHSCFGDRFDLEFITQEAKKRGGLKEVFDIQVTDHERGRVSGIDNFSGGEKTILLESVSLALAIHVGRHSEKRFETLFRDETAGQLEPQNAHNYVTMLRKAREMGGFHQIIYIAQQPEVWGAADVVLYLENGSVDVRLN